MALIKTSDLTQRVEVVKVTNGKDEDGQPIKTEKTVFSCWSCVQTQRLSDVKASIGTVLEGTLFVPLCITDEEADKIISKEESAS